MSVETLSLSTILFGNNKNKKNNVKGRSLGIEKLQVGKSTIKPENRRKEKDIMKGGTQGFPRHEVSDKQEVLFEDVSPSTAFSIRQPLLFVAHFVSGKPLCPALHNIKMRVSSKKSFTLLKRKRKGRRNFAKEEANDRGLIPRAQESITESMTLVDSWTCVKTKMKMKQESLRQFRLRIVLWQSSSSSSFSLSLFLFLSLSFSLFLRLEVEDEHVQSVDRRIAKLKSLSRRLFDSLIVFEDGALLFRQWNQRRQTKARPHLPWLRLS